MHIDPVDIQRRQCLLVEAVAVKTQMRLPHICRVKNIGLQRLMKRHPVDFFNDEPQEDIAGVGIQKLLPGLADGILVVARVGDKF